MAEREAQAAGGATETIFASSEFAQLLQKEFRPKSDQAKTAVEQAVKTLAEQALANTNLVSNDALRTIEGIIAEIDKKLTEQINLILHNEEFQQLESAWRGLHYLVNNTETDETLKIRFFSISKKDLSKTLRKFKGTAWDQSPIFKKVYEEEFGQFGGEPYGSIVADYHSTIRRPTWNCWASCPRSRRRPIRPSSPGRSRRSSRWTAGRNWPIRGI